VGELSIFFATTIHLQINNLINFQVGNQSSVLEVVALRLNLIKCINLDWRKHDGNLEVAILWVIWRRIGLWYFIFWTLAT
jgi:hypothetical protein